MSDLDGNPKDMFSHKVAHILKKNVTNCDTWFSRISLQATAYPEVISMATAYRMLKHQANMPI